MSRPVKIPAQAGIEPRVFRSRGGRLNHWANETVRRRMKRRKKKMKEKRKKKKKEQEEEREEKEVEKEE